MFTKNAMAKRMKCLLYKRRRREEMGWEKSERGSKSTHYYAQKVLSKQTRKTKEIVVDD